MRWMLRAALLCWVCGLLWVGGRGLATLKATPASLLADLPAEVEPGWALVEVALGGERQGRAAALSSELASWFELLAAASAPSGGFRAQVGTGRRAALGARSARLHVFLGERAAPAADDPLLTALARRALGSVSGAGPGELGARFVGCALDGERRVDWAWQGPARTWTDAELPEPAGWRDSASVY